MFKAQSTLDGFFSNSSNKDKKYEIKRYFYLIWTNKYSPQCNAYWCDKKPDKINFIEQVKCDYIKKGYYFYICGYFTENNDRLYNFTKEKVYKNIPYLKSHLQKCIRKQDDHRAIQTCYHLLKMDVVELLRRLPIIMIEDTTIHESFPTLIWLMIAFSHAKFKKEMYIYEWILGIIYVLCKIDIKHDLESVSTSCNSDIPVYKQLDKYNELPELEMSMLYTIHLRIAYGGTEDDMNMLRKCINTNNLVINRMVVKPISIYVKELILAEWDLSAIDYHCNSKFLDYIHKKFDDIEKEELKKIIWYNSSGINHRSKNVNYNLKVWNDIKAHVEKTQKYLLDSSY